MLEFCGPAQLANRLPGLSGHVPLPTSHARAREHTHTHTHTPTNTHAHTQRIRMLSRLCFPTSCFSAAGKLAQRSGTGRRLSGTGRRLYSRSLPLLFQVCSLREMLCCRAYASVRQSVCLVVHRELLLESSSNCIAQAHSRARTRMRTRACAHACQSRSRLHARAHTHMKRSSSCLLARMQ